VIETVLIAAVAGAVASLLVGIRSGDRTLEVLSKTAASAGFVILGAARWSPDAGPATWILIGLMLCAVADVLLLRKRSFDLGLSVFVAGHLAFVAAFVSALPMAAWPLIIAAPVGLAGLGAATWLWPRLGRRRLSVAAYIVAIAVMVWGGLSVAVAGVVGGTVAAGVVLFFVSDLAVARHRFVKPEFINRGVGLPLYYAGQVLIALAI
jgi:uncharacterized membrane protein YhhN